MAGSSAHSPPHPPPPFQARLAALADQWQFLVQKSAEKSQKLKEANKQQNFNTGIKDFDFWLSEVTGCPQGTCGEAQRHKKTPCYGSAS